LKYQINTKISELESYLSDCERSVDQHQRDYNSARDTAIKARARTNLDDALRQFDGYDREKEDLQQSEKEKADHLKSLQLEQKQLANKPLRKKAEELGQQQLSNN
jgi:predicted  nucleic acid-binding Zn-ribbon protein